MHMPLIYWHMSKYKVVYRLKKLPCLKTHSDVVLLQLATKISLFTHLGSFQYASLREIDIFNFSKTKQMVNWYMYIASAVREQVAFEDNWGDFYKMFRNSKISDIFLLEYQHDSSQESFMGIKLSLACSTLPDVREREKKNACKKWLGAWNWLNYHAIVEILP